jgi:hypothetical protein
MWQLADYTAQLGLPSLTAQINVLEPWRGLLAPHWRSALLPPTVSVLQVDARELIAPNRLPLEVYVRQRDLIATYAPSEGRNVQTQIYWRAGQADSASTIELILSAQTHLLDCRPRLLALSTLPAGAVFHLPQEAEQLSELAFDFQARREFTPGECVPLFLFRPHGAAYSYAEMVQPSDFAGASLELRGEELLRFSHPLFAERLEKGVIRRVRLCGAFLPRDGDLERAVAVYRNFIAEPLPLTT